MNFKNYLKMKKLILSAVMMMAFVGTSMAKSGEIEVNKAVVVKIQEQQQHVGGGCDWVCDFTYYLHLYLGESSETANAFSDTAYAGCLANE